jgi:hypothetical protein
MFKYYSSKLSFMVISYLVYFSIILIFQISNYFKRLRIIKRKIVNNKKEKNYKLLLINDKSSLIINFKRNGLF